MNRTAIVTDSASDLPADLAARHAIAIVPLSVAFGNEEFLTGIDLSTDEFWRRLTAPGAPFRRTAAASPGAFRDTFERLFAAGAEGIVYVGVGSQLSATFGSATIARTDLADREIELVDSETASMAIGILALLGAERAEAGAAADEIADALERRKRDVRLYFGLDTLEYLRRGGRLSGPQAAVGTILSVKPIITIERGVVQTVERVRTRGKVTERLLELLTSRPIELAAVLHGMAPDVDAFAAALAARAGLAGDLISTVQVGPSIGPHVGPGALGAAVLYRPDASS